VEAIVAIFLERADFVEFLVQIYRSYIPLKRKTLFLKSSLGRNISGLTLF
jgi:hypothetical protein